MVAIQDPLPDAVPVAAWLPNEPVLGAEHGLYCVGCCWMLMSLLFVGGMMNVLWIAGLALLVLAEKAVPTGHLIPRLAGAGMTAAGLFFLFRAV